MIPILLFFGLCFFGLGDCEDVELTDIVEPVKTYDFNDGWSSTDGVIDCPILGEPEFLIVYSENERYYNCVRISDFGVDVNYETENGYDECVSIGNEFWLSYWENGTRKSVDCVKKAFNCVEWKDMCVSQDVVDVAEFGYTKGYLEAMNNLNQQFSDSGKIEK